MPKAPKVENVKIRKEAFKTTVKGKVIEGERFLVRLGKRFTGTIAQRKRFATQAAATAWVEEQESLKEAQGAAGFTLSGTQRDDAVSALKMVREANLNMSLAALASYVIAREKPQGGVLTLSQALDAYVADKIKAGRAQCYVYRCDRTRAASCNTIGPVPSLR